MTTIARLLLGIVFSWFLARTDCCSAVTWEKIGGVKPETFDSQTILFSTVNSNGITRYCFERCERINCTAFIVDFGKHICYAIEAKDDELIPDPNSTFYHRVCVRVPITCTRRRLWQVERSPGAVLIDSSALHLPNPITRNQCYEKCIEIGGSCESAQFRTSKPLSSNETVLGRCSLSLYERGTRPRAYRASMYRDEYLRDQCRNLSNREYCSYAEFQNVSLPYSDFALSNLNEEQCERRCDASMDGFICRGYTFDNSSGKPVCLLHSEDTTSLGVSSLIDATKTIYRERELCLDLRVQCNDSTMTVMLRTNDPFFGRIYSNGYADTCGVQGTGGNQTMLMLPIPTANNVHQGKLHCGLNPAFSVDDRNRAGVPPISSTIVNVSSQVPIVTMRILDENMRDAMVTHLGQKLILKIQLSPPNGPYDITAGHLVASSASGDASYLLLNEVGCPTDSTTFPALTKDPVDGRSLIATFTAFKFPNSQIVRFNVIVRFCLQKCTPTVCNGDKLSYGKRKRSIESENTHSIYNDETTQMFQNETPEELPLYLSIIVQNPVASSADRLSSRENVSPDTVLITGENSMDGLLCIDASLALSLLIILLIIQIIFIVGCLVTIAQYRRTAIRAEEDRANILARHLYGIHGGNLEIARRVRWADHNASSASHD
ncbi:uncharacterized protein LOC726353 isoform X2 [Apis mellifera]|uniref:Uncharacterized protein LOC726353 isoform X2 n=1 Tax=Apis mellifera TaxID=7460 RepID=A0A7M7GQF7_APIME|nr:uncharacterized protein LOC726353 isoform X2 [Apis mellifera]|eukprot:XP_006563620.1 uncharacterized protein LOC726353 isoform X2 [Apis mellifera]